MKKLRVTVNNKVYDVTVEVLDEQAEVKTNVGSAHVESKAKIAEQKHKPAHAATDGQVVAPMSGSIVRINTKEGDEVKANQALLVLESMKMETQISAPCEGRISTLNVKPGDVVEEGQALLEIDV